MGRKRKSSKEVQAVLKRRKTLCQAQAKLRNRKRDETSRSRLVSFDENEHDDTDSVLFSHISKFEKSTNALHHKVCNRCKCVSLSMKMKRKDGDICSSCGDSGNNRDELEYLPVWYDDNDCAQFHVPEELKCLTDGEKLLIQRASPFVPLHHIKNGVLGMRGHCCCFLQAIEEVCSVLPRFPADVHVVNYVQTYVQEIGGVFKTKQYRINRGRVIRALEWLKKYNKVYSDIEIDKSRLDWMGDNDEGNLLSSVDMEVDHPEVFDKFRETVCGNQNMVDPKSNVEEISYYGVLGETDRVELSKEDQQISRELSSLTRKTKNCNVQDWPQISDKALSEHDSSLKLFCMIFPWLFPGGIGDITCTNDGSMTKESWAKRMIMYKDGRFAKDKAFCFYALNYLMRRRNQSQGSFYVNKFNNGGPVSLSTLKENIENGDKKFIEKVSYFSKQIVGSNAFWRLQREKVYSWINQMVESGHGGPNLFITLSCAEYHWPDIIRLLEERLSIAEGREVNLKGKKNLLVKYCNELTIVVQEYFQERVQLWLKHIGDPIFGIKKYWLRYEFAPGRGQIHVHMLAISNWNIFNHVYEMKLNNEERADHFAKFLRDQIGMTASLHEYDNDEDDYHPCDISFHDVKDHEKDLYLLKKTLMIHECNDYCMRSNKENKKERRCRVGFGEEVTKGKCDTVGMTMQDKDTIEKRDSHMHKKLYLKRNNNRLTQCSESLLRSWRANCDIQILFYDSDPKSPDAEEISEVTDYVVGYCCKGNHTHHDEKKQMQALIMRYVIALLEKKQYFYFRMRSVSEICMFIRFYFLFLQEMKLFQYVFISFVNCYFHFRKLSVSEMNICVVIMKWFYRSSDVRRNAIVLFCFHLVFIVVFISESVRF